jgi:hypothetical protein
MFTLEGRSAIQFVPANGGALKPERSEHDK